MNRLRLGAPVAVGGVTLVPIERVAVASRATPHGGWVSAVKEVVALFIRAEAGVRALGMDGREIPAARLRERVEGLDDWLSANGITAT